MKIPFVHWLTGQLLHEQDIPDDTPARWRVKVALEMSVRARISLDGASLDGASLVGASLDGASLDGASLVGASLDGASLDGASLVGASLVGASLVGARLVSASLVGASLVGASLDGASLDGASLVGASLDGASLDGASLVGASLGNGETLRGERPILHLGPLGSRCAYLEAFITDRGIRVRAGCFFGDLAAFEARVRDVHGDGLHGREYLAAIAMIRAHAEIWTPAESAPAEASV